jgi:hypothetical protein
MVLRTALAAPVAAVALVAVVTLVAALAAAPAQAQVATPAAPIVIDGPSPDIVGLSGLSVARDGTGGLVYIKNVSWAASSERPSRSTRRSPVRPRSR